MLTVGSLFSGVGLLDYGLTLAGLEHAWFCEADEWRRSILRQRWPGRPVHPDIRDIGADSVERVDVIAGGFPCKGASTAGKRTGFGHPETVLWREMARAVRDLRPRYVLVENVANILALHDGALWGEVLGTLAALGYDTVWDCLPAAAVGAPHLRDRVFAVAADANGARRQGGRESERPGNGWARHLVDEDTAGPSPDAVRDGVRQQPESERRSGGAALAGRSGEAPAYSAWLPEGGTGTSTGANGQRTRPSDHAPADAVREGRSAGEGLQGGLAADADVRGRGIGVDWGEYRPAIRRWEAVHGPAPEPLVRRVDDRSAARVERSRLSALGDGVQVQIGRIAGEYILERDAGVTA